MRRTSLFIASSMLCALFLPNMAAEADEKSSVCVMSRLGETFHMKRIGILVFGNEYSSRPIPEWKIDSSVHAMAEKALGGKYDVKHIDIPADANKAVDEMGGGLLNDRTEENRATLSKLAGNVECRYFLLVTAASSQFGGSNQFVGGLGVLEVESMFGNTRLVHTLAQGRVFDGKTYSFLDWQRLRTGQTPFSDPIQGPYGEIEFQAHPSLDAVADDPKTKEIILGQLEQSMKQTLPLMLSVDEPETLTRALHKQQFKKKDDWAPF